MFCPECRKYWSAPVESEDSATSTAKKRKSDAPPTCTNCGSLLAPDRLIAEFPAPEQAQQAGRGIRDRRMTVQDVLRETANPNAVPSFGNVVPLDEQPVSKIGFWAALLQRMHRAHTDEAKERAGVRLRSKMAPLDFALGFAAITAILVFVVSITLHSTFLLSHDAPASAAATMSTQAPASSDAGIGAAALAKILPSNVGYNWGRWESTAQLTPIIGKDGVQTIAASYAYGSHRVRVLAKHFPTTTAAGNWVARMGKDQLIFHTPTGTTSLKAVSAPFDGISTVTFDAPNGSNVLDSYAMPASSDGVSFLAHTRIWQAGDNALTVTSDAMQDRDDFVSGYLSH